MDLPTLHTFLGWCTLLNMGVLLWWWFILTFAHDLVFRLHTKWFQIERERFDAIQCAVMASYKLSVFLFCVIPWIVLHIMAD